MTRARLMVVTGRFTDLAAATRAPASRSRLLPLVLPGTSRALHSNVSAGVLEGIRTLLMTIRRLQISDFAWSIHFAKSRHRPDRDASGLRGRL
jgi:hypothetical protein